MLKNVGVTNSPQYLGEAQRIKNVNCSYALRVELIVGWSTHSKIFINMKITADVLFSPLTESNFFCHGKKRRWQTDEAEVRIEKTEFNYS